MATFDQLSAEQRAIVELVLGRGKDYAELSEMLDVPEPRVRELARDALVDLAPVSAKRVEEDWRGQLADYVLGQQAGPEATATRGHLRRSEAARTWARSLLDSLDQLYDNGSLPAIPDGERPARARRSASPEGGGLGSADAVRRPRVLAGAGTLAVAALLGVLVWPGGVLTGGDDDDPGTERAAADTAPKRAAGAAVLLGQGGDRAIQVQVTGLERSNDRFAYEVWLYDTKDRARSVGGTLTDANGNFAASANLPKNFAGFRFIDISREPVGGPRTHSGQSVLRGAMPDRLAKAEGTQITRLGQVVLSPPPAAG